MRKYLKENKYSLDEKDILGAGSFGKVYRGYDHIQSKWVAIKQIQLSVLQKYGQEMKEIICNEISVMRKFTKNMQEKPCPYLVKHEDCFRTDLYIYIIMELCTAGNLLQFINTNPINQPAAIEIIRSLLTALNYLEQMSIAHRDLKPQNVFIAQQNIDGKDQFIFKIGDFGFSAQKQSFTQIMGTYPFMAPEIFKRQKYTTKVDVWSLGIIAYELIFKDLYFMGKNKWEIQDKVKNVKFALTENQKNKISKQFEDFIVLCLEKDQNKRLKASELLNHPLLVNSQLPLQKKISPPKLSVFDMILKEIQFCQELRTMAQQFANLEHTLNRKTQFMQIYLLKKAYAQMNLVTYSIMSKENYINLKNQDFQELIAQNNQTQYQALREKVQKQCILTSQLFKLKYEAFKIFINQKFNSSAINKILQTINQQSVYEGPHERIFQIQNQKWINVAQYQPQMKKIQVFCQKLKSN